MALARRCWKQLHLWLGFTAGALLVLLGLSGSIITYEQEIDAWLHPGLLLAQGRGAQASVSRMEADARAALPPGAHLYAVRLPHKEGYAAIWLYRNAAGEQRQITADPATGRVLGERSASNPVAWVYRFHASLFMGIAGNVLLAIVAVAVLALLLSGIWLWLPRRAAHWRQALRIAWGRSPDRTFFDLHRVSGAYGAPLLLVLTFTGIYMALPPLMEGAVTLLSPVTPWPAPKASGGSPALNLEAAVARAAQEYPGTRPKVLVMEQPGLYEINLSRPGGRMWRKTGEHVVFIDAATGAVLAKRGPHDGTAGDRFIGWMFPLHNGEAFGEISRALVCLMGVVPSLVAAAGFAMWWRRRAHRSRPANRLTPARSAG